MPTTYTPDRWVVVEVKTPTKKYNKVLASWSGGHLGTNKWRLSSGNETPIEHSDHWEFPQSSGSTYICYKIRYGMTGYAASIYSDWERQNSETYSVWIAPEYEPLE